MLPSGVVPSKFPASTGTKSQLPFDSFQLVSATFGTLTSKKETDGFEINQVYQGYQKNSSYFKKVSEIIDDFLIGSPVFTFDYQPFLVPICRLIQYFHPAAVSKRRTPQALSNADFNFLMSSFFIFHISAVMASFFTLFLVVFHLSKSAGAICQRTPNLSISQPHCTGLPPPAVNFFQ